MPTPSENPSRAPRRHAVLANWRSLRRPGSLKNLKFIKTGKGAGMLRRTLGTGSVSLAKPESRAEPERGVAAP